MNFEFQIIHNQLYLALTSEEADFELLGFGFKEGHTLKKRSLTDILDTLDEKNALKLLEIEASRYPNSGAFLKLSKMAPHFVFHPHDELIFFGGSFNPWHRGHRACLELMGTKPIIILPDRNPFKEIIKVSTLKTYQELIQELNPHHHYLNPEFILREEKNPTFTWIKRTRESFPQLSLSLLMGMDSLDSIHTWYEADQLLQTIDVIYAASRKEDIEKRAEIHHRLNSRYPRLRLVFLGHHEFEDESSTKLREERKKKGP